MFDITAAGMCNPVRRKRTTKKVANNESLDKEAGGVRTGGTTGTGARASSILPMSVIDLQHSLDRWLQNHKNCGVQTSYIMSCMEGDCNFLDKTSTIQQKVDSLLCTGNDDDDDDDNYNNNYDATETERQRPAVNHSSMPRILPILMQLGQLGGVPSWLIAQGHVFSMSYWRMLAVHDVE